VKKFISTTFLALLLASAAIAQPIVGIGEIRIGMSEQEFLQTAEIKSKNLQDASLRKHSTSGSDLWKKTRDSVVPESYARFPEHWKIYTPEYSEYTFKMSTGIKDFMDRDSYDTTVQVYKNEVIYISIQISSSATKFIDILNAKYEKSVVKDNMTKETCQNGYGAKTEHNTGYIANTWGQSNKISAMVMLSSSNCGKYAGASYSISDEKRMQVSEIERKAKQEAKSNETKEKAASSKL
jgi:hypothetical protein